MYDLVGESDISPKTTMIITPMNNCRLELCSGRLEITGGHKGLSEVATFNLKLAG